MKELLSVHIYRYTCVKCGTKFLDNISIDGKVTRPTACLNRHCRKKRYDGSLPDRKKAAQKTWATRRRKKAIGFTKYYICKKCDRPYRTKDQLVAHNERRHKSKSDIAP